MTMQYVPLGAGGVSIIVRATNPDGTARPIPTATSMSIALRGPGGPTTTRAAAFVTDGSDGRFHITTLNGELDRAGVWQYQGYFVESGDNHPTEIGEFEVRHNL